MVRMIIVMLRVLSVCVSKVWISQFLMEWITWIMLVIFVDIMAIVFIPCF